MFSLNFYKSGFVYPNIDSIIVNSEYFSKKIEYLLDCALFEKVKVYDYIAEFLHGNYYKLQAIRIKPTCFFFIKDPTDEMCLEALKADGTNLAHIKSPTYEMIQFAIENTPSALQYVKNQTEQLCLEAIRGDPDTLKYVKNQTDKLCKIAIRYKPSSIEFVREKTDELYILALRKGFRSRRHLMLSNEVRRWCIFYDI